MNYLDIKIGDKRYVQRSKFSKITIYKDDKKQYITDNINLLSTVEKQIINDAINILEDPGAYFKYKTYADDENAIYITDYIGKFTKNVVIPPYINGKVVCGIERIFQNNKEVERIIMPDTIEHIYTETFKKMSNLALVQLPSKITKLPYSIFTDCEKLKYINLENIKAIDEYAFENCKSLEYVCLKSVEQIEQFGFASCQNLKSISLPNVKKIDRYAFERCINLESATLNDELVRIEQGLFSECEKLKDINLPSKTERIEILAFYRCKNLTSIIFPNTLTIIGSSAFDESGLNGEIKLPVNLEGIGQHAFYNTNIKKVKISKETQYLENTFSLDALINIEHYEENEIKENQTKEPER